MAVYNGPFFRFGVLRKTLILRGAGTRARTVDLLITNQLLYQLSYTGVISCNPFVYRGLREAARRFLKGKKGNLCHLFVSPSQKRPLLCRESRTRIGNSRAKIDRSKRWRTDAEGGAGIPRLLPPVRNGTRLF